MTSTKEYFMQKDLYDRWQSYQYFELYLKVNEHWKSQQDYMTYLLNIDEKEASTLTSFVSLSTDAYNLKERRIINIDPDLLPIIEDTKPNFSNLKMKYPVMFINQKIEVDGTIVNGFLVVDVGELESHFPWTADKKGIRVTSVMLNTVDRYEFYSIEPLEDWRKNDGIRKFHVEDSKERKYMSKIAKKVTDMACNVINMLVNDVGDIDFVDQKYTENHNHKRAKKNKPPMRDTITMKVGGSLKQYADEYRQARGEVGVRFFVGGFWRELRSPRYGKRQFTKVWVKPHYRGMKNIPEHHNTFVEVKKK